MNTLEYTRSLYIALLKKRPEFFAFEYKWVLGDKIIDELKADNNPYEPKFCVYGFKHATLYGIDVEIDYYNPYTIKLYEDITYKL